jgi:hypothetical protein
MTRNRSSSACGIRNRRNFFNRCFHDAIAMALRQKARLGSAMIGSSNFSPVFHEIALWTTSENSAGHALLSHLRRLFKK